MPSVKIALFKRVGWSFEDAFRNKKIALLGVINDRTFNEDYSIRGDLMQRKVTTQVTNFFEEISKQKENFCQLGSLNPQIEILGPVKLAGTEILLEWQVLSGVIDLHTQIEALTIPFDPLDDSIYPIRNTLNGVNNWNLLNMAIDFEHKVVVTRSMSRLSGDSYGVQLAQNPMLQLYEHYELSVENQKLQARNQKIRDQDKSKAKALAINYIKAAFFS